MPNPLQIFSIVFKVGLFWSLIILFSVDCVSLDLFANSFILIPLSSVKSLILVGITSFFSM